jgi:DNA-binding response OmpR family regulator
MAQNILVVDDEIDLVQLYEIVLQMAGFNVHSFTSGIKALAQVEEAQPDLVLLDVMMPDVNGIEVCSQIRQMPQIKQPIIFMYSANDSIDNKDRCLEAGADRLISKVVPMDEVAGHIKQVLSARLVH